MKRATILDLVVYILASGGSGKGWRIVVRFMTRVDGDALSNGGSLRCWRPTEYTGSKFETGICPAEQLISFIS